MSSTVGRNSLIMASGTAASRVTGQIRTILLAAASALPVWRPMPIRPVR